MITPPQRQPIAETVRFLRGLATLPSVLIQSTNVPRGRGETVLVVPGFMTGDGFTVALRRFLGRLGYRPEGWGMGRNRGNVSVLVPKVAERLAKLADRTGGPIKLIGWSLGGVLAREAARREPLAVEHIVTMGTPVIGGPKYTAVADYYRHRGVDLDRVEREVAKTNAEPLPMPITAIYSRTDGVVAWQACIDDNPINRVEHIEVKTGHVELGFSAQVYRVIAVALGAPGKGGGR